MGKRKLNSTERRDSRSSASEEVQLALAPYNGRSAGGTGWCKGASDINLTLALQPYRLDLKPQTLLSLYASIWEATKLKRSRPGDIVDDRTAFYSAPQLLCAPP